MPISEVVTIKGKKTGASKHKNQVYINLSKRSRDYFGTKDQNIIAIFFKEEEELTEKDLKEAIEYGKKMKELSVEIEKIKKEMNDHDKKIAKTDGSLGNKKMDMASVRETRNKLDK